MENLFKDNAKLATMGVLTTAGVGLLYMMKNRVTGTQPAVTTQAITATAGTYDKKILLMGSGLMVPSLIENLLENPKYFMTIASNILKDAQTYASKYTNAEAIECDVTNHVILRQSYFDS